MGGVSYDQSLRLEPTQVAGFNQAYRGLISDSIAGALAGSQFDAWGLAWEQKFGPATYLTLEAEWLQAKVDRTIGAIDITGVTLFPVPSATFTSSGTRQQLDYHERNLGITVNQLVGKNWSGGFRYRLSERPQRLRRRPSGKWTPRT